MDVVPTDAVHYELVNLFLAILQEPLVILGVVVQLIRLLLFLASCPLALLLFTAIDILVYGGKYAHDALEQQQYVVEGVDLELLVEGAPEIALVLVFLDEGRLHVYPLQVLNGTEFFALVDFLIVL